jgi:class 3 adenylate cyclase
LAIGHFSLVTFRLRLFLAMLLLVAGVTGAALWIAERSMSAAFEKALDARFEERVARVAKVREVRAEEARALAAAITRSVRVQAALIEHAEDPESTKGDVVHEFARDFLSEDKQRSGWTLRVVDARGRAIAGAEELGPANAQFAWNPDPARVTGALQSGMTTQGLLPAIQRDGGWEAYLSPILDLESEAVLGGLLLARVVTDSGDAGGAGLRVGVLIGGRLVTAGWPHDAERSLAALAGEKRTRGEVMLAGERHAVFLQPLSGSGSGIFPAAVEASAFSLAENQRQRQALRERVLGAGVLAIVAAAVVALVIAGSLSKPVRELVTATHAIGRGDFTARATPRGGELGTLATAFNTMAGDLALKDRYRSTLDLVSDPHIAEDLIAGGLELGGEEREVSVVFCDIRGFTALSEGMEPRAVIEMLNEHFTPLTKVVYEHGGVVLHFVGDLIIALFGAPRRHEHSERSAAACALGMVEERARLNAAGGRKIEVGVGVATGRVVAGRMGSKDRLNYSVFGARMNLASRLCSQAGPMQVVIDAPTLVGCGPAARATPLGALKLKGFSEEIEAFQLLNLDAESSDVAPASGL